MVMIFQNYIFEPKINMGNNYSSINFAIFVTF